MGKLRAEKRPTDFFSGMTSIETSDAVAFRCYVGYEGIDR